VFAVRVRRTDDVPQSQHEVFHAHKNDACIALPRSRPLSRRHRDLAADDAAPAPAGTGKHWAACQAEITKFCSNIEKGKGKGKMRACLTEHTADLSDGCKTSMAEHAAKAKEKEKSGQ